MQAPEQLRESGSSAQTVGTHLRALEYRRRCACGLACAPEKKHAVKTITCKRTGFTNGSAAPIATLRIPLHDANVGDPVALSARKTRFDIFAFEVGGGAV